MLPTGFTFDNNIIICFFRIKPAKNSFQNVLIVMPGVKTNPNIALVRIIEILLSLWVIVKNRSFTGTCILVHHYPVITEYFIVVKNQMASLPNINGFRDNALLIVPARPRWNYRLIFQWVHFINEVIGVIRVFLVPTLAHGILKVAINGFHHIQQQKLYATVHRFVKEAPMAETRITYHKEVKTASFQGRPITLENLTPILSPKAQDKRKREIESCLFEVFIKYAPGRAQVV